MDRPEQRFKPNTRVKLRDGIDPTFYNGYSRVGNEGWIRKRKLDKHGYPQVFIEWDRNHWAYNGQQDGWTWENHFDSVGGEDMGETPKQEPEFEENVRNITETFIKSLFGALGVRSEPADDPDTVSIPLNDEIDDPDNWEDLAADAAQAIQQSPAYIVIALEPLTTPGAPDMMLPRVFCAARQEEYKLIAQSQLAHVLAAMQDDTIADVLQSQVDDSEV